MKNIHFPKLQHLSDKINKKITGNKNANNQTITI